MAKIDLHIHSDYSDGSNSLKNLIKDIVYNNIEIFSLTDHDTIDGCKEIGQFVPPNIKFIPGIELTCESDGIKCHILGYNCDFNNKILSKLLEQGKVLRNKKLETRIEYLKQVWNIELTSDELNWLYSRNSVVKTHLARILVNRGLANDNVSAMKKYLDGCKTENLRFDILETINAIKSANGIPVWAHPLGGEGEEHDSPEIFIPKLKKMITLGIEGLECYYSRYTENETDYLKKCAENNNLYITGGSDYHGNNKIGISLAQLNVNNNYIDSKNLNLPL